ncbi:hypothetical protein ASPCADRAFT_179532 [Aspergillus carbonarius ITEM 5010]|uniref:Uncharacterized protein n=1 Tax=Aspergillus carbonarius (strain ITEM 5010) TaxID=602072 RepID=A0A1R3R6X3_ASPC5|nr:hypothetical protein ASPCADRAFT_179532 [Aspergillus carbonarius ITEM 5010]
MLKVISINDIKVGTATISLPMKQIDFLDMVSVATNVASHSQPGPAIPIRGPQRGLLLLAFLRRSVHLWASIMTRPFHSYGILKEDTATVVDGSTPARSRASACGIYRPLAVFSRSGRILTWMR